MARHRSSSLPSNSYGPYNGRPSTPGSWEGWKGTGDPDARSALLDPSCYRVGGMSEAERGLWSHGRWRGEKAQTDQAPGHDRGPLEPGNTWVPDPGRSRRALEGRLGGQDTTPFPLPKILQVVLSPSKDQGAPPSAIYRPGQADVLAYQPRASRESKTQQKLAPPTTSFLFSSSLGPARRLPRSVQEGQPRRCAENTAQGKAPNSHARARSGAAGVCYGWGGSGGWGKGRGLGPEEGQKW